MPYTTILIERSEADENGQELADKVGAELSYLSNHGLDEFAFIPVQNNGRTVSVIISARGEHPSVEEGRRAFQELTGLDSPLELMQKHGDSNP